MKTKGKMYISIFVSGKDFCKVKQGLQKPFHRKGPTALSMGDLPIVDVTGSLLVFHCRKIKTDDVFLNPACCLSPEETIIKELHIAM